jgi:hypothetical protein
VKSERASHRTPLLAFESNAFPIEPGEDERTNPGVFGKALAIWLSTELKLRGVPTRAVIAEDFGWCIEVDQRPHRLYVACANAPSSITRWQVHAFADVGWLEKLLRREPPAAPLTGLFTTVRRALDELPVAHGVHEMPGNLA